MIRRPVFLAALVMTALLFGGTAADAADRPQFGIRTGVYTDFDDAFLGVEGVFPVNGTIDLVPNLEWVFVDVGDFLTGNIDLAYNVPDHTRTADFWIGGGLALLRSDLGDNFDSNTEVGVNLLAGVALTTGPVSPYVQAKGILADDSQFVITVGLRF